MTITRERDQDVTSTEPSVSPRDSVTARVLRGASIPAAAAAIAVAVEHPAFRNAEGVLAAEVVLPIALATAIGVSGLSLRTSWAAVGRWLSLAVIGQAASLALIDAGNRVAYQHYPTPAEWSTLDRALLGMLAVQAAVVLAAGRAYWRPALERAWRFVGGARLCALLLLLVLCSAALSAEAGAYVLELGLATSVQLVSLATLALAVAAIPSAALHRFARFSDRVLGPASETPEPGGPDRFALIAAAWVLAACAFLAWFVYQAHPHVPDEVVYLYHARYFAAGMLSMPAPPIPAAFDLDLMTFEPARWYSPVPPGWPMALAAGVALGAAWLVNPLLNALNVLLAYTLLREIQDRRTARIAVLLLCASPWFLFMGMNFMTHTFTLACVLIAAVAVARLRRGGGLVWVLPGGAAIGVAGMIRPLEGLTVAVLLGLWGLGSLPWQWSRLARVSALAAVSVAVGALTFPYNAHFTGEARTFPLMAYTDSVYGAGTNALGFGANRGLGWPGLDPFPGHGPLDVAVNAMLNAFATNVELLGWSVGSLLPLLVLLGLGRPSRSDRWLWIALVAIIGVHSLYWFSGGPDFGARYWYLILIPCIALVARVPTAVHAVLAARGSDASGRASDRVLVGMMALSAAALLCFVPWRAVDKYYHYRNMRPDVRELAEQENFGRSLVLIRGRRHPDYASAAIYNPLDLRNPDAPVYVWDNDPAATRAALLEYADRPVWIIEGPTLTGAGFRIISAPDPR